MEVHGQVAITSQGRLRRRWLLVACVGLVLCGIAGPLAYHAMFALGWLMLGIATVGLSLADRDPAQSAGRLGSVTIADDHVMVVGDATGRTWSRDEIVDGYRVPGDVDTLVLCMAGGDEIVVTQPTLRPAEVLGHLGLDQRVVRLSLVADPRGSRGCVGLVVAPVVGGVGASLAGGLGLLLSRGGVAAALIAWVSALVPAALVLGLAHFLVPHRLTVGRDGVLVHRFLRPDRFVSFEELGEVSVSPAFLALTVRGRTLALRASGDAAATAAEAIQERRRAYGAQGRQHVLAALARGDAGWAAWRERLAGLLAGPQPGFRREAVDRDALVRIVEDPGGPPEARVGAAYALAQADLSGEPRLRIAVEGCAEPQLRAALEQALEGELDAAALEEAERRRR